MAVTVVRATEIMFFSSNSASVYFLIKGILRDRNIKIFTKK